MLDGIKKKLSFLKYLDPFYYVDLYVMPRLNPMKIEWVSWVIYLVSALVFAWLIYTLLGLILMTPSPMVIVVSGSMEPVMYRGDVIVMQGVSPENITAEYTELLLPTLRETPMSAFASAEGVPPASLFFINGERIPITEKGDVVVYNSTSFRNLGQPVIHRVVAKVRAEDGLYLITKGDNNNVTDQDCGGVIAGRPDHECKTFYPIPADEISGRALFKIPFVGYVKLLIFDDLTALIFGCPKNSASVLCRQG